FPAYSEMDEGCRGPRLGWSWSFSSGTVSVSQAFQSSLITPPIRSFRRVGSWSIPIAGPPFVREDGVTEGARLIAPAPGPMTHTICCALFIRGIVPDLKHHCQLPYMPAAAR